MPKLIPPPQTEQSPFLTAPEEKSLIAGYRNGLAASARIEAGQPHLNDLDLVVQGRCAEEKLLVSHFPLVRSIARELYLRNNKCVDLEDLISAGNEGLVMAIRKFNPDATNRFSTYASWWVRNRVIMSIRSGRWMLRIPDRIYKQLLKVMKFVGNFVRSTGRRPSVSEISHDLKMSPSTIDRCLAWSNHQELSFDMPVGDDGKSTLADFITEDTFGLSYRAIADTELKDRISQVLKTLTRLEEKVLRLRFGLGVDGSQNLDEIGDSFSITAERVRQIDVRGIRKLRHPVRTKALRPYLRYASEEKQ